MTHPIDWPTVGPRLLEALERIAAMRQGLPIGATRQQQTEYWYRTCIEYRREARAAIAAVKGKNVSARDVVAATAVEVVDAFAVLGDPGAGMAADAILSALRAAGYAVVPVDRLIELIEQTPSPGEADETESGHRYAAGYRDASHAAAEELLRLRDNIIAMLTAAQEPTP